jgi:hypothetical protein
MKNYLIFLVFTTLVCGTSLACIESFKFSVIEAIGFSTMFGTMLIVIVFMIESANVEDTRHIIFGLIASFTFLYPFLVLVLSLIVNLNQAALLGFVGYVALLGFVLSLGFFITRIR